MQFHEHAEERVIAQPGFLCFAEIYKALIVVRPRAKNLEGALEQFLFERLDDFILHAPATQCLEIEAPGHFLVSGA